MRKQSIINRIPEIINWIYATFNYFWIVYCNYPLKKNQLLSLRIALETLVPAKHSVLYISLTLGQGQNVGYSTSVSYFYFHLTQCIPHLTLPPLLLLFFTCSHSK